MESKAKEVLPVHGVNVDSREPRVPRVPKVKEVLQVHVESVAYRVSPEWLVPPGRRVLGVSGESQD